eukprot:COSAG01_NODE_25782_length_733_cov_1.006309_1_plen_204_part_01
MARYHKLSGSAHSGAVVLGATGEGPAVAALGSSNDDSSIGGDGGKPDRGAVMVWDGSLTSSPVPQREYYTRGENCRQFSTSPPAESSSLLLDASVEVGRRQPRPIELAVAGRTVSAQRWQVATTSIKRMSSATKAWSATSGLKFRGANAHDLMRQQLLHAREQSTHQKHKGSACAVAVSSITQVEPVHKIVRRGLSLGRAWLSS